MVSAIHCVEDGLIVRTLPFYFVLRLGKWGTKQEAERRKSTRSSSQRFLYIWREDIKLAGSYSLTGVFGNLPSRALDKPKGSLATKGGPRDPMVCPTAYA